MLVFKAKARALSDADCAAIYRDAHAQGQHAALLIHTPHVAIAMPDGRTLYKPRPGEAGVAYVSVSNIGFRRWASRNRLTGSVNSDKIWVADYNGDLRKKMAYAEAFAKALSGKGITAYAHSILD